MIINKKHRERQYQYDTVKELFLNDLTQKWVKDPRVNDADIKSCYHQLYHPSFDSIVKDIAFNYRQEQRIRFMLFLLNDKITRRSFYNDSKPIEEQETVVSAWINDIRDILGRKDHTRIMYELVEKNVLIKYNMTSPRGKIYTYSFNEVIDYNNISIKSITSKVVHTLIQTYIRKHIKKDKLSTHIVDNNQFIDITRDQIYEIYENKWREFNVRPDKEEYMVNADFCWWMINRWNEGNDDFKYSTMNICDDFGHRFHYIYTYIPSEIRAYSAKKVRCFDVVNSQPAILADLILTSTGCSIKEPFIKAVEECRIYEDTAKRVGCTRKEAKPIIFESMYCKPSQRAQKEFNELYPFTGNEIVKMKSVVEDEDGFEIPLSDSHKELSKSMQRKEAAMWREIWNNLIDWGYDILPLHDSVYIKNATAKQLAYARKYIRSTLKKKFTVKIEVEETKYYNQLKLA